MCRKLHVAYSVQQLGATGRSKSPATPFTFSLSGCLFTCKYLGFEPWSLTRRVRTRMFTLCVPARTRACPLSLRIVFSWNVDVSVRIEWLHRPNRGYRGHYSRPDSEARPHHPKRILQIRLTWSSRAPLSSNPPTTQFSVGLCRRYHQLECRHDTIFGYEANEAIGKPVSFLAWPGEEERIEAFLERVRRGERIDHFEVARKHKSRRRSSSHSAYFRSGTSMA